MMKPVDLRDRNDAPARWRLHFSRIGAVVVEGLMRAGGVIVREVPAQQPSEMSFVDHSFATPTGRARLRSGDDTLDA